jgi:copper chaperone
MIMSTSTYAVSGMTCGHCVSAVTDEILALRGVTDVQVDLVAGGNSEIRVVSDTQLDPSAVAEAVDEAGYQLVTP